MFFENGKVYDKRFVQIKRTDLLYPTNGELKIVKEILLSGAGSLEISSALPIEDEKYIKDFYENKIHFSQSCL